MSDESLESWLATLGRAGEQSIYRMAEGVVKRGAVNIKKDWRANATQSVGNRAPAYPYSITFDPVQRHGGVVDTLIGPDKNKRQGALGNVIEFGSAQHNTRPHWDGKRAAEKEAPNFERFLGDGAVQILMTDSWQGVRP